MIDPITMTMLSALTTPTAAMVWIMPTIVDDDARALELVEKTISDFESASSDFMKRYQAAETDEEREEIRAEGFPQPTEALAKLKEIALAHPRSEAAAKAANWAFGRTRGTADGAWALDVLLTDFMTEEYIDPIITMISQASPSHIKALRTLMEKGPSERIRAIARYNHASQLKDMSGIAERLATITDPEDVYLKFYNDTMDKEFLDALRADGAANRCKEQAVELYEYCAANYGDIDLYPGRTKLGASAESALFELRNLQIGCVAPDIEGVDADGVSFRLSDYRGQVVVLDFWGFW